MQKTGKTPLPGKLASKEILMDFKKSATSSFFDSPIFSSTSATLKDKKTALRAGSDCG
ncbi:MAG TPA: hypothetical protein VGD30_10240 [Telluria sp.]